MNDKISEPLERGWLRTVGEDCELRSQIYDLALNGTHIQLRAMIEAARATTKESR
jgi:hypothetical protein